MKSKFKYLVKSSLKKKIDTKSFKISNVVLAILIIGIINIDSIITFFGGDFNKTYHYFVIDEVGAFDMFNEQMISTTKSIHGEDEEVIVEKYEGKDEELEETIKKDKNNIAVRFIEDKDNLFKVEITSNDKIDSIEYQIILSALNNSKTSLAIQKLNLTEEEIKKLYVAPEVERVVFSEEAGVDENQELIMTTVFPIIILPFFMLTIFLVQMIGAEINDEKTTRGMEIIISNVSPKTHFFSKVVAGNAFVLIQSLLLLAYSGIGLSVRKLIGGNNIMNGVSGEVGTMIDKIFTSSFADKLIFIIPITLVLMLLTFIAYSLVSGILASVTTNQEDFQQLQTPMIIVLLLGYYLSIMAGVFKGSIFIKILAVIPFISAILSPCLLVMGQFGIIEVLIAILLVIFVIYLLVKYGLRAYKVGILNYSSTGLWKKMFKAVKQKQ